MGEFHGHNGSVLDVQFSPDGSIIASGGMDGSVRFWDIASGKNIKTFFDQSTSWGLVTSIDFSPQGDKLVNSRVQTWDIASGRLERRFEALYGTSSGQVFFLPDGERVAVCSFSGDFSNPKSAIQVWRMDNGQEVLRLMDYFCLPGQFLLNDGSVFASDRAGTILILDLNTSETKEAVTTFSGSSMAISPDGAMLALAGEQIKIFAVR